MMGEQNIKSCVMGKYKRMRERQNNIKGLEQSCGPDLLPGRPSVRPGKTKVIGLGLNYFLKA